jgi:uncharacterized protein
MKVVMSLMAQDGDYKEGQKVDLLIVAETELGYKAIINGHHEGILYHGEVFQPLKYGQQLPGFIKKIREDGKIDLILQALGHKSIPDIEQKILDVLTQRNGFLPLDSKTSAEVIYDLFGVSKKKYKMGLGTLYKKRLVTIDDDGIRAVKPPT